MSESLSYYTRVLGEASNTGLGKFRSSPLEYYEWSLGADKRSTKPMRSGTAFHLALHKPDEFERKYIVLPKMSLNSIAKKQDFADATLGELINLDYSVSADESADGLRETVARILSERDIFVLEQPDLDTMHRMIESLNKPCHTLAQTIVSRGTKELELRWADQATGIACKALLDSWDGEPGYMVESDLKRTVKITRRAMSYDARDRGYDHQRAWYRRALREHGLEPTLQFLVCGCPEPPYLWAVYQVPEARICYCYDQHTDELARLRQCLDTNTWNTINYGEAVELNMRNE